MEGAICCEFDCMTWFLEDEQGCYITPVHAPDKKMKEFESSYQMIQFLRSKDFKYDPTTYEFVKNNHRYKLWIY